MSASIVVNGSPVNRAALLAALYNRARPLGMGILHYASEDMTVEQAEELLRSGPFNFDYLQGRVMKVHERDGELHGERLFDRDNGAGAFAEAVLTATCTEPADAD